MIGVQSGTTQANFVQASLSDADIRLYPTQDEVNLDLASGRLDLQVGDLLPLLDWLIKTEDGTCCELIGEPITDPEFVGEGVGIAVRQEDNELREKLNAALEEIREDGTYKTINDKYFPIDVYTMKDAEHDEGVADRRRRPCAAPHRAGRSPLAATLSHWRRRLGRPAPARPDRSPSAGV